MSATRHERVEAEYQWINLVAEPTNIRFIIEYKNIMNCVEYQDPNRGKYNKIFQVYKYVNGVLDEESGCMLELKAYYHI